MKKWLAMLLSIVLAVQLVVPAWAADGGAEQPETVSGGYAETDPAETPAPEPTVEPTVEPTSEPTPEPTAVPVCVRFACTPEELTLAVYPAEGDVDSLILPEEDGSYLLTPGTYTYLAAADGYETAEGSFTVEETAEEQSVEIVLTPAAEENAEPVALAVTTVDSGTCGDNLTWKLTSNGVLTISGTGAMDDHYAPWSSHRNEIQSVKIGYGATRIGAGAFYSTAYTGYTSLTSVTIPSSVTSIGQYAFNSSGLTEVTIPKSVTSIERLAFARCGSLTSVTFSEGVKSIGESAFDSCYKLTSITIPKSVTSIGKSPFYDCPNLRTITVTAGNPVYHSDGNCLIKTADKKLILGCADSVIPTNGSVTSIGEYAFAHCRYSFYSIEIPEGIKSIESAAFYRCLSLKSVTLPESLTSIGSSAFSDCTRLTDITLPEGLTSIGQQYTFYGCSGLESVTIPEGVTSIGQYTFSGCTSLTNITIPASVTSIGNSAFNGCTSLADVYYASTEADWGKITIGSYNAPLLNAAIHYTDPATVASGVCGDDLRWVLYENGVLTISGTGKMSDYPADTGAPWFGWRDQITSVVIRPGAASIGSRAFCQCNKLTSVTIPDGVASIGDFAFSPCSSLASITIPDSVTTVGKMAFNGCKSLADGNGFVIVRDVLYDYYGDGWAAVTIPSGVTRIDNSAFFNDTIIGVTIPDSVTSIGNAAFYDCSSLKTATIPDSVTSIGNKAFSGCSNLTSVKIPASMTSIEDETFRGCSSLTSVEIPASVTSVGKSAFYGCTSLKDVYYTSCSEAGWKNITIGSYNDPLQNATVHYLEHQWDEGVVTTEPTYEKDGIKTFTCSICKATKTETISAPTPIAFGTCGSADNEGGESSVKWSLFEDGILIISGTGAMADWEDSEPAPWSDYRPEIKTVVINPGITVIGRYAFDRCTNLTNVTIPDSVTCIRFWAFHACGFTDITIPEGVERIESAFYECCELTSIVIPKSATSVAGFAFECCSSLASITVAQGNPVYHSDGNCLILTADKTLIAGCKNSAIPADGSVTRIDTYAFSGHTGLMNITIPDTVTSIGELAFMACSGLETILVAEGNPVYHSDGNCIIKTADKTLVVGCKNSVIPADGSVTSIGRYAFFACSGLTSITIPEGVTSIGGSAFWACTSLTDVYYSGCSEAKWNSITVGEQNDPFQNATVHYLEHQWNDGEITTPATCTENGVKTFTCSVCKETKTETIEKLGHAFGAVEVIKAPTCTETGISGKRCTHEGCKVIDSETVIPATGHQWDNGKITTEPTCTEDGVKTYTCSVCSETRTEEIKATGHKWNDGEITTPATCTENGVKTFTCSVCKETKTETIEKLGHAFGEVEVIKAPTCTETGISGKRCQHNGCEVIDSETVIPATGHQWDDGKVTTEPTCTEDGVKTYTCSVCSETKTEEIKATGHKWNDGEITTPATCTEDGVKTYTCSVCKEIKTETVEKLGHAFGAVEVIKAPTCTETGISGKRCQHNGCEVIDSETVIPATGHQWDDGKVTTEPTCTENGIKTYTCSVCSETKTETITATGHQWNDGEITTPATCTENGVKTFTCSVCKETKTETVEKLGHAFGEVEVIKAPTCTETGISGKRCTHEGCKVIDSETVIPATGHQWDEGVVTREPTYTEDGEKTFTCTVCRATRTESIPALTPEPDSVDLNEIANDFDGSSIGMDVDGKTVYPDGEGNYPRLTVPEGTTALISVSTYNLPEGVDPHTRYPVSMAVYKATNTDGTTSIERISEMDDLLRYAGSSIRITGNKGIRLITGIDASLKNALTGEGVAGYTLEEYGTLLCWSSEVQNGSLSLSDGYARHNYAYSLANGTDPVFRYAGNVVQYTNVLVGFSNEQCVDDIAMRPYITLRDADGNTYTLYGGIVNRSIGYIAYQNRGAFTPGTNAYNYIWDIIHFVYGDAYDEDYKG